MLAYCVEYHLCRKLVLLRYTCSEGKQALHSNAVEPAKSLPQKKKVQTKCGEEGGKVVSFLGPTIEPERLCRLVMVPKK